MVPELIKSLWVQRWDLEIEMARSITFNYAVENLISANGSAETDTGLIETFKTTQ